MHYFGIRDLPIESIGDESLGLIPYIQSLSDFVLACETPMTIAIQGDWGSGKTSAMNMIREKISSEVVPIWFNTWQFSQFEMQKELSISLLSYFVDELDDKEATFKKKIGGLLKGLGKMTAAVIAEQTVGETMAGKIADAQSEPVDSAKALKNLKSELHKAVEQKLKLANKARIVVFIDDLDRLQPEKAVEMLEVMKLFLDLPFCVFVLAVDYGVVIRGVRKKYGDEKGRSFFDKIIQLPFNMPVAQYNIENYFSDLLKKTKIQFSDKDVRLYRDLAAYSIGINPRGLKRLFNLLLLLNITAKNQNLLESSEEVKVSERQKVIFGVLCLQSGFEEAYRFLSRSNISEELLRSMADRDKLKNSLEFESLRKDIKDDEKIEKLAEFIEVFIEALQTEYDGEDKISNKEIKNLLEILRFSSITSLDESRASNGLNYNERKENREALKHFSEELNKKYKQKLKLLKEQFYVYQPRDESYASLYLHIQSNGLFSINFSFDQNGFAIYESDSGSKVNSSAGIQFFNSAFSGLGFDKIDYENEIAFSEKFEESHPFNKKLERFKSKTAETLEKVFERLS
ncbi:MAG: AAA family ATPase [Campylobacterales bacterium]|nr:AAA family ATPase [Campylobacterales bacterium]